MSTAYDPHGSRLQITAPEAYPQHFTTRIRPSAEHGAVGHLTMDGGVTINVYGRRDMAALDDLIDALVSMREDMRTALRDHDIKVAS